MPREVKFFDLFNAHTKEIVRGADALVAVMAALNQSQAAAAAHAETLDTIEGRADKIVDEIHQLIKHLDDVLDTMQDAAGTVTTYDIRRATPEAIRFADIIRASCQVVAKAVGMLHNMNNGPAILEASKEISKLKAIYELLETVTDCCKQVATILEAIILENS